MHQESLDIMAYYLAGIEPTFKGNTIRILDVGSRRIGNNSTYKQLLDPSRYSYKGLDVEAGPNVDIVPADGTLLLVGPISKLSTAR